MNKRNYQKELDELLANLYKGGDNSKKRLLIHSCCAPCSSYCLLYLSQYFDITCFFYNPNISPVEEYDKRVKEIKRFISEINGEYSLSIEFMEGKYEPERFYEMAKGLEDAPEGGERCFACYRMRLEEAAKLAEKIGADYFTTTLSISPLKNAEKINEIGEELADIYDVSHLPSDFKKKNGYKTSIELSRKYDLYRQNYCGCVYSKRGV